MAKADITGRLNLDSTGFQRGIQRSKQSVQGFAKSSMATFVRMGAAFAGIGLVKSIIGLGVSAAETADKFNAVFGKAAGAMNERILELKKTIPATTKELQDALSIFGSMAQGMGLNSEAAQEFSVNMVKIAGDLASFHELQPDEVFNKMRAAITGEFEPLKSMGIMLNEAKVKQEALNLGIWDGVGALSSSQKAMSVQSLIVTQMGAASGNAALTVNSAANQLKFLQRNLRDTGAEIGTTILPAVADLTQGMLELLKWSKKAAEAVGEAFANVIYGDTKKDPLAGFREAAAQKLAREGKLSTAKGSGGVAQRKKQIEEEATLLKAAYDERLALQKKVKEETNDEGEVIEEISKDQQKINELNEQLVQSIKDQIKAQGKFKAEQAIIKAAAKEKADKENRIKEMKLAALKAETRGEEDLAKAMRNRIALAERIMKIMAETGASQSDATIIANKQLLDELGSTQKAQSGKIQTGKITTIGSGTRESRFGAMPTMEERERAAGLYLAGGDPMSGRRPSGMRAGEGEKKDKSEQQIEQLKEVNKKLSKLDGALSGDN
jgi:hypothetical protein